MEARVSGDPLLEVGVKIQIRDENQNVVLEQRPIKVHRCVNNESHRSSADRPKSGAQKDKRADKPPAAAPSATLSIAPSRFPASSTSSSGTSFSFLGNQPSSSNQQTNEKSQASLNFPFGLTNQTVLSTSSASTSNPTFNFQIPADGEGFDELASNDSTFSKPADFKGFDGAGEALFSPLNVAPPATSAGERERRVSGDGWTMPAREFMELVYKQKSPPEDGLMTARNILEMVYKRKFTPEVGLMSLPELVKYVFNQPTIPDNNLMSAPEILGVQDKPKSIPEDEEHAQDFVPTANFAPLIPLPPLVESKLGSENEILVFEHRAVLYRFDSTSKEWKERRAGPIKILQDKDNPKQVRVAMWREKVGKLACNHRITGDMTMELHKDKDKDKKVLKWLAIDHAEDEARPEIFACRFEQKDKSAEFKSVFEKMVDLVGSRTEPAPNVSGGSANASSSVDLDGGAEPWMEFEKNVK